MSTFEVKVVSIDDIEPIANADRIELARFKDYRSVVGKATFKPGDLAVYLPEASILPEWVTDKLGVTGKLRGKDKNRIKAVKLRGTVSQGILYPVRLTTASDGKLVYVLDVVEDFEDAIHYVRLGTDCAEYLGIRKYEPPIPSHLRGEVANIHGYTLHFDIENIKRYPDVLVEGEEVVFREKTHGTFCQVGYIPGLDHSELFCGGNVYVARKGLGSQGLVFKNVPENRNNVYVRTMTDMDLGDALKAMAKLLDTSEPVYMLGEIFGAGVQDLHYSRGDQVFYGFDIFVGKPTLGRFLSPLERVKLFQAVGVPSMPWLYQGPFNRAVVEQFTSGPSVVGCGAHNREGIVITPMTERSHPEIGRVILKSVSDWYLTDRKNGTEHN